MSDDTQGRAISHDADGGLGAPHEVQTVAKGHEVQIACRRAAKHPENPDDMFVVSITNVSDTVESEVSCCPLCGEPLREDANYWVSES